MKNLLSAIDFFVYLTKELDANGYTLTMDIDVKDLNLYSINEIIQTYSGERTKSEICVHFIYGTILGYEFPATIKNEYMTLDVMLVPIYTVNEGKEQFYYGFDFVYKNGQCEPFDNVKDMGKNFSSEFFDLNIKHILKELESLNENH
jgi:hypothetical protein